jgi:hypothetical protein
VRACARMHASVCFGVHPSVCLFSSYGIVQIRLERRLTERWTDRQIEGGGISHSNTTLDLMLIEIKFSYPKISIT